MAITFLGSDVDHWCYVEELQSFPHDQQKYISIPYNKEDSQGFYSNHFLKYTVLMIPLRVC